MLDWLIRHSPTSASHAIGEIIGEAQRRLNISREVSEHSIRTALVLDSNLAPSVRDEFLDIVFTPASTGDHTPVTRATKPALVDPLRPDGVAGPAEVPLPAIASRILVSLSGAARSVASVRIVPSPFLDAPPFSKTSPMAATTLNSVPAGAGAVGGTLLVPPLLPQPTKTSAATVTGYGEARISRPRGASWRRLPCGR
jgi:hypothetical protein